jgi:CO/xanthine dehydrogenase Mo-binding subunit
MEQKPAGKDDAMSHENDRELALELAQHQVDGVLHWFDVDRRGFLKMLGGGVLVCLAVRHAPAQESGRTRGNQQLPQDVAAWLHVAQDEHVTAYTGKVEMGQNVRTSLAQQVAEELRVPLNAITMVMGDTDLTPWDAGTFGSRTTPTMGPQLRNMAAEARDLLTEMAAQAWNTQPAGLIAADGKIANPATGKSLTYGELTHGQKLVKVVGGDPPLTPAAQWKIAGTPAPKVDVRDFVTGRHQYTSDLSRPGMLYGKVLRPSGFKATLVSVDTQEAENISGVDLVHDGDFIGVAALDPSTAERALAALKAQWNVPAQPSNAELFDYFKKNADAGERGQQHVVGSVEQAIASADVKLAQQYTVQYIAHAPLEPRAAVAEWDGDKLTVWTGTQRPFAVRDELASALRISTDKVRVLVPDTGSAYGGKHTGDAAVEAARLARHAGKPVKVTWTREEEMTWAYFRPAGVIDVRSGARRDGTLVAWEFHNYNSGPAAIGTPYEVANQAIQFHPVNSPLRQGSYRGLAATANHFARESHMDELAHALHMDPLEFRLKNIKDPRLRAVFEAAAEKFGWSKQKAASGRGFGIAGGFEKGGYVATCAEVEVDLARVVHIRRVVEAFECGAIINPSGLRNQVAGSIVQAIGGALFEAIRFENGRVINPHFAQYRLPRFADSPEIEVVMLDRKDLPSAGAGETPIVGLAPAVGNAVFAATGVRLRSLPMAPQGIPIASCKLRADECRQLPRARTRGPT